jgi:hypothetical protein
MGSFFLRWTAIPGAAGYNVHSGQYSGFYTDNSDVGNTLSATITVPWTGPGYAVVAAYNGSHYEGEYSAEYPIDSSGTLPPTGTLVLTIRSLI